MTYSQKYTLIHFISPVDVGDQFHMSEWPLHITLADVFAIDHSSSDIDRKLNELLENTLPVKTAAAKDVVLGQTPVVLIEKNQHLMSLHAKIVNLLEANGAVFNTPEFTHEGFLPHSTIQSGQRLIENDTVNIDSISLVDMFPNSDWRLRKVLATFKLKQE